MDRLFDHLDLRVSSLAQVRLFYEAFLPALGFTRKTEIPGWLQYEAESPDNGPAAFFGVAESAHHLPNKTRVAFWMPSPERLDRLATVALLAGAINPEGPGWEDKTYYAFFFEDPCGNRLELCYRTAPSEVRS